MAHHIPKRAQLAAPSPAIKYRFTTIPKTGMVDQRYRIEATVKPANTA